MRLSSWFPYTLSLSLWTASVLAAEGSDVIDLDSSNFDSIVKPESLILVEFFAPW